MNFVFVLIAALLIAGPAAADPATLIITALGISATNVVAIALVRIVVGLAISAVGQALQAKRRRSASQRSDGGIRTDVTTQGGITPQSFILGRYATAGNITAPFYAHGDAGGVSNAYRTQIIDLSDVPVTGLYEVWVDGRRFNVATDFTGAVHPDYGMSLNPTLQPRYAGSVWLKFYDGTQTVADPMLVAKYGGHAQRPWTSAMIGRGVAYAIMTFKYNTTLFKAEPQCLFVVDGIKLYDWRKDGTAGGVGAHRWANQATWEFTENPVVMDYNIKRGLPLPDGDTYGMGVAALDLPIAWWTAAANVADQTVSSLPRYRAGYEVRMATAEDGGDTPLDISDELMLSCAGALCDFGGTWIIRAGEVSLPVAAITDDDILRNKPQELDQFKGMAQTFNAVRASYPEPNQQWRPREAPPRYDAAAEAEDGQRLVANLTLPAAPFRVQVQRLMRAWLRDARRMRQHSIQMSHFLRHLMGSTNRSCNL